MTRIALMNDYQKVALRCADWGSLPADCKVEVFHDHPWEEAEIAARLAPFDIVMAMRERTPFPRSLLEKLPNLKLLATAGMRNAAIDVPAATDLGILVCGTGGASEATAEITWALILAVMRHVPREHRATQEGGWQQTLGVMLRRKTLGLLGLGRIGGMVAAVGAAFGMRLIAWSQNLTDERAGACGAERVTFEALLRESDVLTIHTVLSDRTRGLLGEKELALLKPGAFLVNSSRGPIISEQALVNTLRAKAIAGAGLDVFDREPLPADHPLLKLDNVVLTPHLGYVTEEVYRFFYGETLENIAAFLKGEPTRVLNPDVLPKMRGG